MTCFPLKGSMLLQPCRSHQQRCFTCLFLISSSASFPGVAVRYLRPYLSNTLSIYFSEDIAFPAVAKYRSGVYRPVGHFSNLPVSESDTRRTESVPSQAFPVVMAHIKKQLSCVVFFFFMSFFCTLSCPIIESDPS